MRTKSLRMVGGINWFLGPFLRLFLMIEFMSWTIGIHKSNLARALAITNFHYTYPNWKCQSQKRIASARIFCSSDFLSYSFHPIVKNNISWISMVLSRIFPFSETNVMKILKNTTQKIQFSFPQLKKLFKLLSNI